MGLVTAITRQLDNGYVQVDASSKGTATLYYEVPQAKADLFCNELKKEDKKNKYITNGVFGCSILGGIIIAYPLTKKISSSVLKFILNVSAGVAASILGILGTSKYILKEHDELLKKYNAKEIFYS